MPKTLADMTPDERSSFVGMWATNLAYTGDGEDVGVIACVQHDRVWLIHPHIHGEWSVFPADAIAPRPDLPRAWTPYGTPPQGEWEKGGYFDFTPGASPLPIQGRRWISEWEPVNEKR